MKYTFVRTIHKFLYKISRTDFDCLINKKFHIFAISAVRSPLSVLLGLKSMPKIVNGKVIAGESRSAGLTLLKKLPGLDKKPTLNQPDDQDLYDYDGDYSEYDEPLNKNYDELYAKNFGPISYATPQPVKALIKDLNMPIDHGSSFVPGLSAY